MDGRLQTGGQRAPVVRSLLRTRSEIDQSVPRDAAPVDRPVARHQLVVVGHRGRGLRAAQVLQKTQGKAGPAHTRRARQPQGFDVDGGQDELHQSVAVVAGIRFVVVRGQVYGSQERRVAGHRVQPIDAHGHHDRRSHKDMEIQHDEGVEHQLGSQAHDDPVRRRQHNIRLSVGRLQGDTRVHRRLHIPVDALQRGEPDAERRAVPQTDRRLVVVEKPAGRRSRRRRGFGLPAVPRRARDAGTRERRYSNERLARVARKQNCTYNTRAFTYRT